MTLACQPVAEQAASAEGLGQALEGHVPLRLKQAERVLEARERMLDALAGTAERDVVRSSSCCFCCAACDGQRELARNVSCLAALITSIRNVAEEEERRVEEHAARFVERCDLTASLGLVAPVHVAKATWARTRADTSDEQVH